MKLKQAMTAMLSLSVVLLLVIGVYQATMTLLSQPVTRVVVNGDFVRVNQQDIAKQVEPFLSSGFIALDLDSIRRQLLQDPWVFDVTLERRWPDEIVIAVKEQAPIAQWGLRGFVNHRGNLFMPTEKISLQVSLPQLAGPDDRVDEVMSHFRELRRPLADQNMQLEQLQLDDRGNWSARLAGGVLIVLGDGQVMEKMKRFLQVHAMGLSADIDNIKRIDMRYSNGFAVAWRQPAKQRG
ncbi:MAG: cell division protein FtsQ [Oceanicoccus sp.]